ncbi:MAG: cytochrome C [Acidobacteria bacterium]|nr:cytochrome C [Acidobacteriota bacterium]
MLRTLSVPLAAALFIFTVGVEGRAPQGGRGREGAPGAQGGRGREGAPGAQGGQGRGGRGQVTLPDGAGKEMVTATCGTCHGLNQIVNSRGYTRDGWQKLFATMVALPNDQVESMSTYLATNFPLKPGPDAVIVPGQASVNFREWLLPTLGQRPHDPLAAADGSVWWTGQFAARLGRVDPPTNAIREFPLPTPDTQAHGLVEDSAGNIWYTAINKQYIGKLDPRTGQVTEYPVPEPGRNPHTPIFDQKGTLWFTMQSGHVGRVIPSTGEVRVQATPSTGTYPYGIRVNSKGVPWYVDFRGPRIGSVDPVTMQITEHPLPNADARPRRIAITSDDAIWYTDYPRGMIGRFDPSTHTVKEYPSPGGPQSLPYGIAHVGDVIWYSESGVRPNTLVRFDTRTERFQTWAIPAGGGVVRHMMASKEGNLVLAESGVNHVALVEVR